MRTVDVVFVGTINRYTYLVPDYLPDLNQDDYATVLVGSVPKLVRVVASPSSTPQKATKHLATVVDLSLYYKEVAKISKKSELLKKLAKLEAEQNEFIRFELLARNNPEAAELLRQLKEI